MLAVAPPAPVSGQAGPARWVAGAAMAVMLAGAAGLGALGSFGAAALAPGRGLGLLAVALLGVAGVSLALAATLATGALLARPILPPMTAASVAVAVATGLVLLVGLVVRPTIVVGIVVLAAVFVPLERAFALRRQRVFRAGWATDLVHLVVNNLLSLAGVAVGLLTVGLMARAAVPGALRSAIAGQPRWAQFAMAFLIVEVVGYWSHRAAHTVPFLWRFHKVHHSPPELDWLAAARLHPLDQAIGRTCVAVPLFALGFSAATFGAYLAVAGVQAIFVHANVRFRFGPLRWLVATPEFHHWHHAVDGDAQDRNFAGQLPLLDAVFGSLHLPSDRRPGGYGIDEAPPAGYLRQLAWPFHRPAGGPF